MFETMANRAEFTYSMISSKKAGFTSFSIYKGPQELLNLGKQAKNSTGKIFKTG